MICGLRGSVLWRGREESNLRRSGISLAVSAKTEWLDLEEGTDLHFSELAADM